MRTLRLTEATPELPLQQLAQRLSNIRRFCGDPEALTVLQHSLLTELFARRSGKCAVRRAALLHDVAEAYTADLPRELKNDIKTHWPADRPLPWQVYERRILTQYFPAAKYGPWPEQQVAYYDDVATALEMSQMELYCRSNFVRKYATELVLSDDEQADVDFIYTAHTTELLRRFFDLV